MGTSVQTTYAAAPAVGVAGQPADEGPRDVASASMAVGTIAAGLVLVRGSTDGLARPLAVGDVPVTGTTQIMTAKATSAAAQVLSGASLDGATGGTVMWPPRNLVLTLNNNANWLASTIIVEGLNAAGEPCQEAFEVSAAGNATLTGVVSFSQVTAVKIPIEGGAGGTLAVGTGIAMGAIDRKVYGIAMYTSAREPGPYAIGEEVPIMRKGRIYATSEVAVTRGDPVYVRVDASGAGVFGGLSNAPSTSVMARLHGARWGSTIAAPGIAVVELNLPAS
jgi:hypothetical protein